MKRSLALFSALGVLALILSTPATAQPKPPQECGTFICLAGILQTRDGSPVGCGLNLHCFPHADAYFNICRCGGGDCPAFLPAATKAARWSLWLSRCAIYIPSVDVEKIRQVHDLYGDRAYGPATYEHGCSLEPTLNYCNPGGRSPQACPCPGDSPGW